ncbi:hypothetical protein [Actinobacillus porcinus]|uniref:hypothetical protein n=1 Tax=Actinobacillus porcinus TaxID=51048 RepID=UPI002352F240|nr:hypothetical protein [Actinobacillus porcinus]
MDWLDWLKVGGVVIVLLAILGTYLERKEKAELKRQEEMKEEEYFYDALEKNICPQCGAKGTLKELDDEKVYGPYVFKGMVTETERCTGDERRMESWQIHFENVLGCTQCDYHKSYKDKINYDIKYIADNGSSCPKCNKTDSVYLKGVKTADRYQANKEVEEQTARGTKTRYIKVTKVVEEETYACKNCDFTSVATLTKELK